MRILGITVVKDEADIILPFLEHVRTFADRAFVYDTGSTDGTWELVQQQADAVVVPWKREDVPFHNELRARVFNAFRDEAREGDWWCYRLDVDEFYLEDPRAVLESVPKRYHTVCRESIDYTVTLEDVDEYEFTGDFAVDREHLHYMRPKMGIENRFFRHRDRAVWYEKGRSTVNGIVFPKRIPIAHYRARSPQQVQRRIEKKHAYLQRKAVEKGRKQPDEVSAYPPAPDAWKRSVPSRDRCILDTGPEARARLVMPSDVIRRHHETTFSYFAKRILHGTGVRP